METLKVLEEKIIALMNLVSTLKADNAKLAEENAQLSAEIKTLKGTFNSGAKRLEELDQEKAATKMIVNDLIKDIESLVNK